MALNGSWTVGKLDLESKDMRFFAGIKFPFVSIINKHTTLCNNATLIGNVIYCANFPFPSTYMEDDFYS